MKLVKKFIYILNILHIKPLAKVSHHTSIKRGIILKRVKPDEVLKVRILDNLINGFFVGETKFYLND